MMPKKIIRAEEKYEIRSFNFKIFSSTQRGVSKYVLKRFEQQEEDVTSTKGEAKSVKEQKKDERKDNSFSDIELKKIEEEAEKRGYQKGLEEGYQKGLNEGLKKAEDFKKEYEAKREDYLNLLKDGISSVVANIEEIRKMIDALDEDLPKLVLEYIKELIGVERKINDELILSVFKKHTAKLKEVADATIYVNPEDIEIVREMFPDYHFEPDEEIVKGGFKVKTNIGEFDFTIETLIKNFQKVLNEEITTSKES